MILKRLFSSKIPIYIMIGIPGSGKSTWIKNNLSPDIPIVSRDIIRAELGFTRGVDEKAVCTKAQEEEVSKVERELVKTYIESGQSFVLDDTNTSRYAAEFIKGLRKLGNVNLIGVKMNTPLKICQERRKAQIPGRVLEGMEKRMRGLDYKIFDKIIEV